MTITDCPVTIAEGDTFAVYVDGAAQVYTAKSVTVSGADTVITTQEVDINEVVEDVDAQGTEEGDLSEAEAIGDTEIVYIEGGTEAQSFEDGKMYKSARIAGTKNIRAIKASKTVNLGSGAKFTITCTLSDVKVDYKVSIADQEAYVKADGDATFSGTVATGSIGSGSVDLVNIPVAYVGVIKVSVDYGINGEVTLSYTTGFRTGIQYSNWEGFRLVKSFQKKSFTIQSRTELSAGVTASVGLTKLPVVSGSMYAKMGAKTRMESKTYNDGKTPNTCITVSSWMYASVGANAGLDFGFTKKSFSKSYDIYNLQNSPVRVVYHFEDGKLTHPCTRGWDYASGYFTRWNSRYGSAWDGYGLDDSGTLVPVFTYTTDDDGNATITGYTGYASALVIPSEIDGHTVVAIGDNAFKDRTELYSVVMPDTVTRIGRRAFENTALTGLELPENLTSIGAEILRGNTGVSEITIPKSVMEMYYDGVTGNVGAFNGSQVQRAEFEEGITQVPAYAFQGATNLQEVSIPDTVTRIGRGAFENTGFVTVCLQDNIAYLEKNVFANCVNLEEVNWNNTLSEIPKSTFSRCTALKKFNVTDAIQIIGENAFQNCESLESFDSTKNITTIESNAFNKCSALKTVAIGDSVTSIGQSAFSECISLENITIGKNVTIINNNAFNNCDALKEISLPDSVETIGNSAFYDCDSLAAIIIPDSVTSIGSSIFYDCDALTDVTLGTGITSIPSSAFEHCDALQSIVLPYRTATVGANAFKNCVALTEITIPRATTSIDATAFSYPSKMTVYGIAGTYAETFANEQGMKFVNREVKATEVKLSQMELKLNRGAKEKLVMTVTPADFTDEVTWRSSNTDVATIDDSGQVTAKAVGETTIKVTVGDVSASCKVTVVQPVTSISLNKSSLEMNALDTYQLTANVSPSNADNKSVQWSSSDATIASVDESGLVSAHKKGTAVITVAAQDGSGVTRSCNVTVKNSAHIAAAPEELESPHNYENNCSDFWVYTQEGAEGLQVTFDARTNIEEDFDYLYIFRADGEQVGMYTGTELAGQTVYVPGDTVKIQLVSDNAGNEWGFKVSDITAGALQKLPQTIAGTVSYEKMYGDEDFTLDTEVTQGDGSLSYRSEDENVVVVSGNGTVSIVGAGQTNIVVTASETDHYNKTEKKISVSVAKKTLTEEEVMQLDSRFDFHYGTAEEASVVDLRELLPENSGQVQFHPDVNIAGQEGLIFDTFVDESGRLSYQVNPGTLGEKAKLQVTVSSDNYEDFTLVVTVELICMHADESQYEIRNAKKADCTENGYTGDVFCSICGQKVKDGTIIAPFGHQWDAGRVTQEPTADTNGVKTYTCERCGVTKTESIPAVSEPTDDTETPGGGTTTPGSGSQPGGTGTTPGSQNGGASGTGADGQGNHISGNTGSQQNTLRANAIARNSATGETCRIIQPGQTVEYLTAPNKKTVTVPDTIVINGVRHKVTSIANNAFKNNKKLKSVVIGKNITKIGKKAFFGCQNLKKITIKTTKLKTKTVGAKAFTKAGSKNYNKLTVKVPKKCKKTYPKILKKKGLSGRAKIR